MTNWEEQMAHEPTREYYEAIKEYFGDTFYKKGLVGKKVLEIGYQYGISAKAFVELGAEVTSIDPNEPLMPLIKGVDLHKKKSDEFFKDNKKCFDLIYIDGDHHFKTTKSDLNNAMVYIKKPGVIVIHDFLHNDNFRNDKSYGITQACCEFLKERKLNAEIKPPYPGFLIIYIT